MTAPKSRRQKLEKISHRMGWFASAMALAMYFSYIDQIRLNLSGQPGSLALPLATVVNCLAWSLYGFTKNTKDWPLIVCNVPGVLLGALTALTTFL